MTLVLIPFIDVMTFQHVLYRGFTQLSYALDFIQSGRFRLGRLDVYQDIEDISRSDNSEGMGHFVSPDGASMHFELGNPTYLFCCSVGDVDIAFLRRRMGPFIVRITQPNQLTLLIDDFLKEKQIKTFGGIKGTQVQYNKGQIVRDELNAANRAFLSLSQKHQCFAEEHEYRFYAIINIECPIELLTRFLLIDLECRLPFVELLPCEK